MSVAISVYCLSCIGWEGVEVVVNAVSVGICQEWIGSCGYFSVVEQRIAIVIGVGVVALPVAIGVQRLSCISGECIEVVVDAIGVSVCQEWVGASGYFSVVEQGIPIVIGIGVVALPVAIGV